MTFKVAVWFRKPPPPFLCWNDYLCETDNPTFPPTSQRDWPPVRRWESRHGLNFSVKLSFVLCYTTISVWTTKCNTNHKTKCFLAPRFSEVKFAGRWPSFLFVLPFCLLQWRTRFCTGPAPVSRCKRQSGCGCAGRSTSLGGCPPYFYSFTPALPHFFSCSPHLSLLPLLSIHCSVSLPPNFLVQEGRRHIFLKFIGSLSFHYVKCRVLFLNHWL